MTPAPFLRRGLHSIDVPIPADPDALWEMIGRVDHRTARRIARAAVADLRVARARIAELEQQLAAQATTGDT